MTIHIDAVFENGAFRPADPVMLEEGTHVVLTIDAEAPLQPPQRLVAALAEIAAMSPQSPDDGFLGADHDEMLYGAEGAR
jgi:predicted DNA-binding antitoxin AbrB/MazE fold protein